MQNLFQAYLDAGFSVIPIRHDGTKAPAVPWKAFAKDRVEPAEAAGWAKRYRGVGLVCGAVSGNVEVVDVDEPALVRPYIEAVARADTLLAQKLALVETPRRNESGQAGLHIYYRVEGVVSGNTKLAMSEPEPEFDQAGEPVLDPQTGKQKMKPRTLIETRGEGGYVLLPGCAPECHPTGNQYKHIDGPGLESLATLSAGERDTLHNIARMFDRSVAETHTEPPTAFSGGNPAEMPGSVFNERATWAEILEGHGWTCIGEHGGVKQWRRPGKSTGISATTGILSKQGNELLVVFSTNAHPFEGVNASGRPGVAYSKFAAYAALNHSGDFQAASRRLAELGYGSMPSKPERKNRALKLTCKQAESNYFKALAAGKCNLLSTGIEPLDRAFGGGVERGEMVIVGGLPSHGKTVCALQALRKNAEAGRHGVLVSHEMGSLAIAKRMIASRTPLEDSEWLGVIDRLEGDSERYWSSCGELFVLEQCRDIGQIEKEVDEIAREFDITMLVIDHAQLTYGKGSTRYEQITYASGRFKEMAVKHNCVALVLSQLSREAARGDVESHHLKESGALEQDADCIAVVRWPWKAAPDKEEPERYEIKVLKNRNRPITEWLVRTTFNPARQTIGGRPYVTPFAGL